MFSFTINLYSFKLFSPIQGGSLFMESNHLSKLETLENLPTKGAAQAFGVEGQTLRRALCVDGHYLGIRPVKLPNGRLLWSTDRIRQILEAR